MNRVMLAKLQQKLLKERSDWLLHFYLDNISNWPYWHIDTPDVSPDSTPTSYSSSSSDERDSLQAVTVYRKLQVKRNELFLKPRRRVGVKSGGADLQLRLWLWSLILKILKTPPKSGGSSAPSSPYYATPLF